MGLGLMTSKETFQKYDTDSKLETLFDFVKAIHEKQCRRTQECQAQFAACQIRFNKFERRRYIHKGIAGIAGLLGGYLASMLDRIL